MPKTLPNNSPFALQDWSEGPTSPLPHVEAQTTRIGNKVYVIGGYASLYIANDKIQIWDGDTQTWSVGPRLPAGCPRTHAGIANDGKFIYLISGQPGPGCFPATEKCWALNTQDNTWHPLAPLPARRYAPVLSYLDGNLHLVSGAAEDRVTIAKDHFILRLRDGRAGESLELPPLERQTWTNGPPIPEGGDHGVSVALSGMMYVIGGEHGHGRMTLDFKQCCGVHIVHDFLFRYDPRRAAWERLADMPVGASHCEGSTLVLNGHIVVFGGAADRLVFLDTVQAYAPDMNRWQLLKPLPLARKGGVAWETGGTLYLNGGQTSPRPRPIDRFDEKLELTCRTAKAGIAWNSPVR